MCIRDRMKILSGVYRADEGEIFIEGEKVIIDSVAKAHELGVSIIMQELNMCGHLSVADNIFIGRADVYKRQGEWAQTDPHIAGR